MRKRLSTLPLLVAFALGASLATACATSTDEPDADPTQAEDELSAAGKVTPNDVSILYPMPAATEMNALLSPTSAGAKGELLPRSIYDHLPILDQQRRSDYASVRVVAIRIDPCFAIPGASESECKNQIRLVMQPVHADEDSGKLEASDAAAHAFYDITRANLASFVREYLELKRQAGSYRSTNLKVHPLLAKQGVSGRFAQGLAALVLSYAGKENLSRVTFLTREASRQEQWKLGGFDISGRTVTPMKIATLGSETSQLVSNPGFGATLFRDGVTPAPRADDNIGALMSDAARVVTKPRAEVVKLLEAALRIENPKSHSPDTIDCASCHLTHARLAVQEAVRDFDAIANANAFKSSVSLKGANLTNGGALHAFSYKGDAALISQRVVNESAAVVEYVNAKVLSRR